MTIVELLVETRSVGTLDYWGETLSRMDLDTRADILVLRSVEMNRLSVKVPLILSQVRDPAIAEVSDPDLIVWSIRIHGSPKKMWICISIRTYKY